MSNNTNFEDKTNVYLLQHCYEDESGSEQVKLIGVFASEKDAELVVERLCKQPGFGMYPDGFSIDKYELNKTFWGDGFEL